MLCASASPNASAAGRVSVGGLGWLPTSHLWAARNAKEETIVRWYQRLVSLNDEVYDLRKFGWRGLGRCLVTVLAISALGVLMAQLLPSHRTPIARATRVLLGLGVGFVYERNSGLPVLLLVYMGAAGWQSVSLKYPVLVNLRVIALWLGIPLAGFGLGSLVRSYKESDRI